MATFFDQSSLPSALFRQRSIRSFPCSMALVRNSLSPLTTGWQWLSPGIGTRQRKSFSVQVTGTDFESLTPDPLGPRKRVHSCAPASARRAKDARSISEGLFIVRLG